MSKTEWEVNHHNPSYQTRNGDISIKLQNNDDVDLRFKGYEYTVSVSVANESGVSEGIIKSHRSVDSNADPDMGVGEKITFNFNNVFSVRRH